MNLHWLHSPELPLQDDAILLLMTSYDVKWHANLDPSSWIILFFRAKGIMEINTNSRHNAYNMYKLVNSCNLMITGKKYRMISKKSSFGQTYMKFAVVLATSHNILISQRMNEQLIRVSLPQSKSSFQKCETPPPDFLLLNCTLILLWNFKLKQRRAFILPLPKQLFHCLLVVDFHR